MSGANAHLSSIPRLNMDEDLRKTIVDRTPPRRQHSAEVNEQSTGSSKSSDCFDRSKDKQRITAETDDDRDDIQPVYQRKDSLNITSANILFPRQIDRTFDSTDDNEENIQLTNRVNIRMKRKLFDLFRSRIIGCQHLTNSNKNINND